MTWELLNTGNVAWSPDYRLHFVRGFNTSLYTTSQTLDRWVYPGETIEISLPSHVPAKVGDYYAAWNLATDYGADFYTVDFYFSVDEDETLPTQTARVITVIPPHHNPLPFPPYHKITPFPPPHYFPTPPWVDPLPHPKPDPPPPLFPVPDQQPPNRLPEPVASPSLEQPSLNQPPLLPQVTLTETGLP